MTTLEKIRAEIEQYSLLTRERTIRIIDKYAEQEPKIGHWVRKGQGIYCSECCKESGYNPFGASRFSDFCPNCGVKMESEE